MGGVALASLTQGDFSAGIFRGRKAPDNAVYDAVNLLVNDEGLLFKRGGSEYYSASNAGSDLTRIASVYFPGPEVDRVLAWGTELYALDGSLAAQEMYAAAEDIVGRPVAVGGVLVWPLVTTTISSKKYCQILVYGGSVLSGGLVFDEGTITVTAGSAAVTKSGGATWAGVVDPGMIVAPAGGGSYGIVRSVDGANALTLAYPWEGTTTATTSYSIYSALVATLATSTPAPAVPATNDLKLGSAARRLLAASGNRVYLCPPGFPFDFDPEVYHELPAGAEIVGIQGVGDTAAVFSTEGVWTISDLSLDPVDAFGNIQHVVEQISGEVVLWGELGLTTWQAGAMIVPALDDIYVMGLDGSTTRVTGDPENERIRRLYRSYTATDGYRPGQASVHRGHLFMPVLNSSDEVVDELVCRLDRGLAWTRWSGHAASAGFAVLPATESAAPKLLGVAGERVTDLSSTFDPSASNALDADGEDFDATIITRDYPTGGNQHGFVQRLRARYEMVDGGTPDPAVTVAYSSDQDAGAFTTLTEKGLQGGGTGGTTSDGAKYNWWLVGKRRERIRFRFTISGACASFVLRSVELLLRPTGKQ